VKQRIYVSNLRLTTSVWQSVWGWLAVLNRNEVPWILKSSFQKELMNKGSLSETIKLGMPCNLQISTKNLEARSGAEKIVEWKPVEM